MGTKSHISKALPASIMTKRMGLIMLQGAMFRTGCVYLNFPGHFLYVFHHYNVQKRAKVQRTPLRRDLEVLHYRILFYSFLFYMEMMVGESSFHVCVKRSAHALFTPYWMPSGSLPFVTLLLSLSSKFSLSQNIGNREFKSLASSLWAFASIFHMHYETLLIKLQVYAMTRLPSICNKCLFFFPPVSSYSVISGGWRLDESDFMPVSKPKVFYL